MTVRDKPDPLREKMHVWFRRLERWLILPMAGLLLALSAYSRYLIVYEWQRIVLAPRVLLTVGLVVIIVWSAGAIITKQFHLRGTDLWWLGVPVLLAVWSVISLTWYDTPDARIYLTEFWLYGLMLSLLVGVIGRAARNRDVLLIATIIGAAGVILIGVVEKLTDTHLPFSNLHNPYREQWAVTSVFINQNHLAAHIALVLPLIAGAALTYKRIRVLLWTVFVLGVGVLFFTGSILGVGAALIAGLTFSVVTLLRTERIRNRARAIAALVLLTIASVTVIWFAMPDSIAERFSVQAEGVRKSITERTQLVRDGFAITTERPLMGHGAAGAELAVRELGNTRVQNLHNLTIELAVNFGAIAAMAFVAWWISLIVGAFRVRSYIALGVAVSLIGLVLAQAAPSTFVGVRILFVVLGLAISFSSSHATRARQF